MTNFLPSKKFTIVTLSCLFLFVAIFLLNKYRPWERASKDDTATENISGITVAQLAEKDANTNGIPDWEEALWGLDPAGDGVKNKSTIDARRQALVADNTAANQPVARTSLDETQTFSRSVFAAISTLKESGTLNADSIKNLANTVGQQIGVSKDIPPTHTLSEIKTVPATADSREKYFEAVEKVILAQEDVPLGDELPVVEQALNDEDGRIYAKMTVFSKAYKELGSALFAITPPTDVATTHLAVVNGVLAMATVTSNLSQVIDNPLVGAIGIGQYQIYRKASDDAFDALTLYFTVNGMVQ